MSPKCPLAFVATLLIFSVACAAQSDLEVSEAVSVDQATKSKGNRDEADDLADILRSLSPEKLDMLRSFLKYMMNEEDGQEVLDEQQQSRVSRGRKLLDGGSALYYQYKIDKTNEDISAFKTAWKQRKAARIAGKSDAKVAKMMKGSKSYRKGMKPLLAKRNRFQNKFWEREAVEIGLAKRGNANPSLHGTAPGKQFPPAEYADQIMKRPFYNKAARHQMRFGKPLRP
mmetsp:Transcript_8459/g.13840  ORF Transcript_8459/g.13840 Transcript_8459/m.13840 type:complete len:228 (+) Transcript_8459:75-758(+)|eukprot:CAMPEP_0184647326 /NCGR_PEP_ID=MMETSP0308-20130426/4216_1 /TAXON_ID=38269 /ORGANISM="Gloeochaete witrockiana, Strain SAG 46.84" /LENGTH=227 /DNA_ID=CAMNT_0027078175 /DNA_START=50 /DNA_END=733 /DNA_ORIENTATION=-